MLFRTTDSDNDVANVLCIYDPGGVFSYEMISHRSGIENSFLQYV